MFADFSLESISVLTFITVFLFGCVICFTPCVYPIVPVIVSYIGGSEIKTKKEAFFRSLSYVFGMVCVYSILGAVAAFTGGLFGMVQANFWVNLLVANVFILFGLFMLDVFQMPQITFFQRKNKLPKRNLVGAFFMGAVSGLIIGPCTTPVLGGILTYVAAKQNVFLGISLLFTYALGMGLPLLVLGTFVGLLKKIPKPGYWMVLVKKVFGLILIGIGEYFLIHLA